jgi:HD superfamily phosphohydrolase
MDYLYRDSLHAGVPYGMHFDRGRLIGSLCIDERDSRLAITPKGCTAAELMVVARYVMFSEVYWHHAVRAATAMLQRAVHELHGRLELEPLFRSDDTQFTRALVDAGSGSRAASLVDGLFGERRRLYKRVAQFSVLEDEPLFHRLSRKPYADLVRCGNELAALLCDACKVDLEPADVLVDAPPPGLEIQFHIPVRYDAPRRYRWLGEVSPLVQTLATRQFDNYVKRVRVFVAPDYARRVRESGQVRKLLPVAIDRAGL